MAKSIESRLGLPTMASLASGIVFIEKIRPARSLREFLIDIGYVRGKIPMVETLRSETSGLFGTDFLSCCIIPINGRPEEQLVS